MSKVHKFLGKKRKTRDINETISEYFNNKHRFRLRKDGEKCKVQKTRILTV
jgi:hypothetical protein